MKAIVDPTAFMSLSVIYSALQLLEKDEKKHSEYANRLAILSALNLSRIEVDFFSLIGATDPASLFVGKTTPANVTLIVEIISLVQPSSARMFLSSVT